VLLVVDGDRADRFFALRALRSILKESLGTDAAEQMTAGYYEDLFQHSSRSISTNRLVTGQWAANWSRWQRMDLKSTRRRVDGFLYYELQPNVDIPEFNDRLITNSLGLADREYTVEPPPGAHRLSIIGDSVARGMGATHGKCFEALLEEELNRLRPVPDVAEYEILNFGVGGYRITQMLNVLETKAVRFSPKLHILIFSDVTVFRKWGDHISQLVHDGIDLHYPWLRDLAERAGLRPDDDPATLDAKLAPYRSETIRWALEKMREDAGRQGAEVIVVLVPTVTEPAAIRERFEGVADLVRDLGLPMIDVLDTFEGIQDLEPYRLSPFNHHPNDAGHRLIYERLMERLQEAPPAWLLVTGG
jgi:hypothetical protein